MATTTVSIGSNQSIDTETPAGSSGGGPSYVITFGTTPSGISVGDIGFMDTEDAGGGGASDYTFLVTAISGANITLKYLTDTGGKGDNSPLGLYTGGGSSGSPTQAPMVFKRAFSTITLFEAMIDDSSPAYWGTSDDVVGECYADSAFTDSRVYFDNKQSLASVKLTVNSDDRHDGTAGSGVVIRPTAGSGHNNAIIDVNIDNFIMEWIEIDLGSLDAQNTNKAVVLRGTNDDNIIRNNLLHDKGGNPGGTGPFLIHALTGTSGSGDTLSILNNIIYSIIETSNDNAAGILVDAWAGIINVYNNTVYNVQSAGSTKVAIGIRAGRISGSTANVKNNIVAGLVSAASNGERAYEHGPANGGSGTFNEAYNLSDDTSATAYDASGTGSLIDKSLAEIDFVSTVAGSEDLHLDTGSVCLEAGVDLGTTNEVNIDIDGVDRDATGVTWDMGADQASVSDAGSPAFMMFLD
jgi:hypothetical protein